MVVNGSLGSCKARRFKLSPEHPLPIYEPFIHKKCSYQLSNLFDLLQPHCQTWQVVQESLSSAAANASGSSLPNGTANTPGEVFCHLCAKCELHQIRTVHRAALSLLMIPLITSAACVQAEFSCQASVLYGKPE